MNKIKILYEKDLNIIGEKYYGLNWVIFGYSGYTYDQHHYHAIEEHCVLIYVLGNETFKQSQYKLIHKIFEENLSIKQKIKMTEISLNQKYL